jgi:S-adenosylmethionine synthetase
MAEDCEIQLSYAIGKADPVSIAVFGKLNESNKEITNWILENYDLTPRGIIDFLDLAKPIYSQTSCYGHFGKSEMKWEECK